MPANALFDTRFLNSARIQRILEIAGSTLERERPLTFLDRLNLVNANDDELFGRFTARSFAADIIADGQKAVVYEGGKVDIIVSALANIKEGQNLSQATLNLLSRLSQNNGRAVEEDQLFDWETRFGENLLQGVREAMNEMACAMMIDNYAYNRWGVILSGATWGMPANLKATVNPAWSLDAGVTSNAANAHPVQDIFAMDIVDQANYGFGPFTRVTMSTPAFFRMIETDEFKAKMTAFTGLNFALPAAASLTNDRGRMLEVAGRVLEKEVIIDDKVVRRQSADGTQPAPTRVLPVNKVLLDRTSNGPREWDFGNGEVTESVVASLLGAPVLGQNPRLEIGGAFGPLGYYTAQSADLNPPGVNGWAVARGWPRKHVFECSAVLTVW
jgi:hypothetical protein